MKRYVFIVLAGILILACHNSACGSSWSLPIGGADSAFSVRQTNDGGYVATGTAFPAGIWVIKLKADSSVEWQKTYGGSADLAYSVQQTADGGYIVAGYAYINGSAFTDAWLLKLNADGSVAWQKTYGGAGADYASAIQQTDDGGYIVAGSTDSFGAGTSDAWVMKLNANGIVVWYKTYGGTASDYAYAIQQTADGGFIVTGSTCSFCNGGDNAWVLKLDATGSVEWQKTYGGTDVRSVQQTTDGGFIVAGDTYSFGAGNSDASVMRLNADGSVAWQNSYGGSGSDHAGSVQQTADGGFIVAGYTNSFGAGSYDAWAFKLNAEGSIAWQKTYGGAGRDYADSIQQTVDGGYIVAGSVGALGYGYGDAWILKLDQNGGIMGCNAVTITASTVTVTTTSVAPVNSTAVPARATVVTTSTNVTPSDSNAAAATNCYYTPSSSKWMKTYGGSGDDVAESVQQTSDGGYVVAGFTGSFGAGSHDAWVLKLNAEGAVSWQKTFGGTDYDYAMSVQQTTDGGYIVAGTTSSFGVGVYDAWIVKLNADGSIAWQKMYGGAGNDSASSIQQTTDGGYIIAGNTTSFGAGGYDAWVLKLNADGSVAWQKTYGGLGWEFANSIQQTSDGGYIVVGYTDPCAGDFNCSDSNYAWLIKLDAEGNIGWQKTFANYDNISSIKQSVGGYIVAGNVYVPPSGGPGTYGTYNIGVLKLNEDGTIAWQKAYGGANGVDAGSIQQTADGGYIVAGYSGSFGTGDAWLLKIDANGIFAWQKTYGGFGNEIVYSIEQTIDGGYVAAGYTTSFGAGGADAWVMKLDQKGDITGCANVASSSVTIRYPTAAASTSDFTSSVSSATASDSRATVTDTAVTPGGICSASYDQYMLNVVLVGAGTGRVISLPSGMSCRNDEVPPSILPGGVSGSVSVGGPCSSPFTSGSLTLIASPSYSAIFAGWSGDCNTSGQVTMNTDKTCIAAFDSSTDFSGSPRFGYAPFLVDFTASINGFTSWRWDFGDQTVYGMPLVMNTGNAISHIYRSVGMYTVSMMADAGFMGAFAKKEDYITVAPCPYGSVRIDGPQYYPSLTTAYGNLGGSGSIDLQMMEFGENFVMSSSRTVTLTGGYDCFYGSRSGDSEISGSLTIDGSSGPVTVDGITIH